MVSFFAVKWLGQFVCHYVFITKIQKDNEFVVYEIPEVMQENVNLSVLLKFANSNGQINISSVLLR